MFSFEVEKQLGQARLTRLVTPHGEVAGPFFQFVATQGAVRGQVMSEDLEALGVQIVLANTYHLHVRPGEEIVQEAGGLHGFMQWGRPITTDSGGYQVFSLGKRLKLDADGVTFRSPLDGSEHRLTPEKTIAIQEQLGADIIMPLDIATPFTAERAEVEAAVTQTTAWARRCKEALGGATSERQALYGIVQGALLPDLRERSAAELTEIGFFGYSIGGELRDVAASRMEEGVGITVPHLPHDAPRYLMGAGSPADIVRTARLGVDQYDCVLPIRDARHGRIYRNLNLEELERCLVDPERPVEPEKLYEVLTITRAQHARDWSLFAPGNPAIPKDYTVGYVQHLLRVEPPSGFRLAVLNNIYFYVQLMQGIRSVIDKHGES